MSELIPKHPLYTVDQDIVFNLEDSTAAMGRIISAEMQPEEGEWTYKIAMGDNQPWTTLESNVTHFYDKTRWKAVEEKDIQAFDL